MNPSHSSNPSYAMSSTIADITDLPYPKGELTQAPPAVPLRKPSVLSQKHKRETVSEDTISTLEKASPVSEAEKQRKHESYLLSGSVFLVTEYGQILNLPTPSDSPADPLGWKRWQRVGAFVALAWFATVAVAVAQAAGSLLRVMSIEFDSEGIPPWQLEWLVTAPILFMGIGAFVWIPLSIGVGRRPSALLASLTLTAASLGAGYSQCFSTLLACVCFLGLGAGFAVQTAFLIAIDITFIHERSRAIALLWSFAGFFGTSAVAIVPYISNGGNSWRPYYQYWSLPAMVATALIFFLLPETYFKRPTVAFDGLIVMQSATEKLTVFRDIEANSDIYRDLPPLPNHQGILGRLNFWRSPFASWTSMGRCYLQIGFCFLNPLIFWIVIAAAVNFISSTYISTTFPRVLGSEPYDLSAEETTLLNLASALGGLLAYPIGILPIEKIMDRLARSNNGVREAEHYLIGLVLPVTTGALSTVIYGCAVEDGLHLTAYYFANGFNGFSCIALSISTTMWVTEAFPRWAAPALAVLSGGSYILSFCMTLSIWPWIMAHGFRLVGIEIAVLQIVIGLIAVPITFFGKSARQAIHGRWADERGGALRPL